MIMSVNDTVTCPHCKAPVLQEARVCPVCGYALKNAAIPWRALLLGFAAFLTIIIVVGGSVWYLSTLQPFASSPRIVISLPTIYITGTPSPLILITTTSTDTLTPTSTHIPVVTDTPKFLCPNAPPMRVRVGDTARVTFTDGLPLRVRSVPELDPNNITDLIAEGTRFSIVGGPACASEPGSSRQAIFWKITIDTSNLVGWVIEGDPDNYYIERWP
jgi:hypothetical protein